MPFFRTYHVRSIWYTTQNQLTDPKPAICNLEVCNFTIYNLKTLGKAILFETRRLRTLATGGFGLKQQSSFENWMKMAEWSDMSFISPTSEVFNADFISV